MRSFLLVLCLVAATSLSAQKILASEEFEAENIKSVTVKGAFCDVYVEPGDKVYFKGVIEGKGDEGDYEILSDLDGTDLEIRVDSRRNNWGWGWNELRTKLELRIPSDVELTIDNSSGDIYIDDISPSELNVEASSGDISISKVRGSLEVEATSGDLELRDITGDLLARTTSGDQEIKGIGGSIQTGATSGDIELEDFEGDAEAKTTSGEITVRRGKGAMSFRTTSGNIDGYDLELTDDLLLRASSGDIEIELINDLSQLNFDLESSSGDLEVGSRSSDRDLYIKEGPDYFWVRATTSSGNMDFSN